MFELGDEPTHLTNFENTHTHTHTHTHDWQDMLKFQVNFSKPFIWLRHD